MGRPLAHDLGDVLFVSGIGVRVQEADGQGLDLLGEEAVERSLHLGRVERLEHRAVGIDALVDLHAEIALHQRHGLLPREIVELGHSDPPDLEDVAESGGRDKAGPRALELEDRVGGDRGAVQHLGEIASAEAGLAEQLAQAVDNGARVVVDARRDLLRVNAAAGVEQHDVGEGAADVDADAEARGHGHSPILI